MITFFDIKIPSFWQECPESQTKETCSLRKYLEQQEQMYRFFPVNNTLAATTTDWDKIRNSIDKMHNICKQCQTTNNKTK